MYVRGALTYSLLNFQLTTYFRYIRKYFKHPETCNAAILIGDLQHNHTYYEVIQSDIILIESVAFRFSYD